MNILQEDKELREIREMETSYAKACDLHRQYELQVIAKRLQFRKNCPHFEYITSIYCDPFDISKRVQTLFHCTRCGELIKKEYK